MTDVAALVSQEQRARLVREAAAAIGRNLERAGDAAEARAFNELARVGSDPALAQLGRMIR